MKHFAPTHSLTTWFVLCAVVAVLVSPRHGCSAADASLVTSVQLCAPMSDALVRSSVTGRLLPLLSSDNSTLQCVLDALAAAGDKTAWRGGCVGTTGSAKYLQAVTVDSASAARSRLPLAALTPSSASDVALALSAARTCALRVSILSGGHSAAAYSLYPGGLTLDLRTHLGYVHLVSTANVAVTDVVDDDDVAAELVVGAGARWADVYAEVLAHNSSLLPVGGGCPQVSLGFHFRSL